ncbi:hypothetical protein [Pseudomonas violetae]|jgi:hypothetical protein|uniref:Uncharacterized protein n=1 Tax=Pseudomonas violetae TaxID=2915813 RepID=A0ABT0F5X4_9PSED|nr:hypothetical protein [Pseudomonas violetae]MCK1793382.1 hypothetical protein [Pseudomonas violetae]
MLLEERLEFIDSLPELPIVPQPRSFAEANLTTPPIHDPSKPTATILPGTIDAYLPGVPQSVIDDVDLCKLVMQNSANKMFPEDDRIFEWYLHYVNGLSNLGWAFQSRDIQERTIKRIGLTMDAVALEIAQSLIGKDAALALSLIGGKALDMLKDDPKNIKIFNSGSDLGKKAKFDIAPIWLDSAGAPNMILNCISLDARESKQGILFWRSTKQSTVVKTGAVRTYLSLNNFSPIRKELQNKYNVAAKQYISQLPDLSFD